MIAPALPFKTPTRSSSKSSKTHSDTRPDTTHLRLKISGLLKEMSAENGKEPKTPSRKGDGVTGSTPSTPGTVKRAVTSHNWREMPATPSGKGYQSGQQWQTPSSKGRLHWQTPNGHLRTTTPGEFHHQNGSAMPQQGGFYPQNDGIMPMYPSNGMPMFNGAMTMQSGNPMLQGGNQGGYPVSHVAPPPGWPAPGGWVTPSGRQYIPPKTPVSAKTLVTARTPGHPKTPVSAKTPGSGQPKTPGSGQPKTPGSGQPKTPRHANKETNNLFKTELCTNFAEKKECRYGHTCQFAHGPEELREVKRHEQWKTKTCKAWLQGGCSYGGRCCYLRKFALVQCQGF
jgi:hypothetical protein